MTAKRIPTHIGDVLILRTTQSYTIHAVGRVSKDGVQDLGPQRDITYANDHATAVAETKALVAPGRKMFLQDIDTECPYGYYDSAPYDCAPVGYYGPEWFNEGDFHGAGPWFHGPIDFRGNVNNTFHPAHGYKGPTPKRGEKADPSKRVDSAHFHSNEERDGRGHVSETKR